MEETETKYRRLLGKALENLEEVCKSKGYNLKYDFKQDSKEGQSICLIINNPANGGYVRLRIWGARYGSKIDNVHIVRNEAKETIVDRMKQMTAQVEILTEELSRKNLSMRDEVVARELILNLLCGFSFIPTWRELATISRISLEYGFELDYNRSRYDILSIRNNIKASEESIDRLLYDYRETYGIDENFIKDIQALVRHEVRPYLNVIRKYFPKHIVVLSMIGEKDLSNGEYSLVEDAMLESNRTMRLEYAQKILHKLASNIPEDRKKALRLLMGEYLEKAAGDTEALALFKKIIDNKWMYWFARNNVENAKIFAKIVGKIIGVENIVGVDWRSLNIFNINKGTEIPVVTTRDGYSIFLMMPTKKFFRITIYPESRMFGEEAHKPYTDLRIYTSTKIGKQHLEYVRIFVDESKNYFRAALKRGREMLSEDETLLTYVKASSIAGGSLRINIPTVEISIGSSLPERGAFINLLRNRFNRKLEDLEIIAGKLRVSKIKKPQQY